MTTPTNHDHASSASDEVVTRIFQPNPDAKPADYADFQLTEIELALIVSKEI